MSSCCSSSCCCANKDTAEKQELKEVLHTWLKAVSSGTPDGVMTLYTDSAVFMPASVPNVCDTPAKRLEYFTAFTANENLQGTINELHTRVFGEIGINSGLYTFTFTKNGQPVTMTVRFSFVYKKTPLGWMIVDHHSSFIPAGN
ncbi:MAG: DUF4440 domain-containing protein [Alphaproteobacteria bacterium]|nr:DUF4440 domain-containing protein [Alphaproteobacteria bacterium]